MIDASDYQNTRQDNPHYNDNAASFEQMPMHERLAQLQDRIAKIQSWWEDEAAYDAIVSSGRYLKLCTVTEQADTVAEHLRQSALTMMATLASAHTEPDVKPNPDKAASNVVAFQPQGRRWA